MVQEHAGERRAHVEQARIQAADLRQAQERAAAAERRVLEDVDRARQEVKQAKRELAETQQVLMKDLKALEQANVALTRQHQESQVEIAALRERLAGAETRTTDLQRLLDMHGGAGESRLVKGKEPGKAGSSPQPAAKRVAGSTRKLQRRA
jgi:chromosome segregation ATPase